MASRWLWRLQTLLRGALGDEDETALSKSNYYLDWSRAIDHVAPNNVSASSRPAPTPPVTDRWLGKKGRQLSITQIKTWVRDPYSIYAKKVLRLYPLEDLDAPLSPREYGNAIHKGLESFVEAYPKDLPKDAEIKLIHALTNAMRAEGFEDFSIAKDQTRLEKIAAKIVDWMRDRRATGWAVRGVETKGKLYLEDVDFTLTGTPDMVEKGVSGFAINDYKTGAPATVKVVKAGFDPQLPLAAYMLSKGAFKGLGSGPTEELNYIRVKGSGDEDLIKSITPPARDAIPAMAYAEESIAALKKLITEFNQESTAYYSQPRVQYTHDYGEYDHLARRDEWARLGSEGGEWGYGS